MRVLLDTTYLLPIVKVNVDKIDGKFLKKTLSKKELKFYYCDISLFELAAKATKLMLDNEDVKPSDLIKGLDALKESDRILNLSWHSNPLILELAKQIRIIHSDYIDCLIFATAACFTDVIATYDQSLFNKICSNKQVIDEICLINPSFKFWFFDLEKKWISLS